MELDLHVHTRRSLDSRNAPARIFEVARQRGLGGVAICDHNTLEGAQAALALAPPGFLVVPGMEISTRFGHLLGLFLRTEVRTRDPFEAVDAIHAQGGLAVLAHPFARHREIDPAFAKRLDGCEGYNARYGRASRRRGPGGEPRALAFAREYHLALTGGSDAHFLWEIGRGRTAVEASTLAEVRRAILDRKTAVRAVKASSIFNRAYSGVVRLARRRAKGADA